MWEERHLISYTIYTLYFNKKKQWLLSFSWRSCASKNWVIEFLWTIKLYRNWRMLIRWSDIHLCALKKCVKTNKKIIEYLKMRCSSSSIHTINNNQGLVFFLHVRNQQNVSLFFLLTWLIWETEWFPKREVALLINW